MNGLLSVADAIQSMLDSAGDFLPEQEFCPLMSLDGRILAEPVVATITFPVFDNSAMDGYALRYTDAKQLTGTGLPVKGTVYAGHALDTPLAAGSVVRIMTGAPLPEGADTVIMQEQTRLVDGVLFATQLPAQGEHVRHRGEDMQQGETLLLPGTRLTPRHIGLLAGLGLTGVRVYRRLRVALFSSGDELRQPGEPLAGSQIYDSNRFALTAMLQRLPVDIITSRWLPDAPGLVESALRDAAGTADVVITSAGVSVGDADYMRDIIAGLGQVNFWKVAMKPGKPFAFGRLGRGWYFGLPGNPVSSMATLDQLAQPLLRRLSGELGYRPVQLPAVADTAIRKQPGRADYQRGIYHLADGQLHASPAGGQGSGLLRGFCTTDCYLVLPSEQGDTAVGESVQIQPFGALLK
ncbi:molybdopterin molybdotransferase MoeA [Thalassolituus marinus]|uniref:Molybdopterin molybdenumtransferase n=1 Tax=Thalassolituus marinus TaxID=671053 RepID=A0ABS7ZPX2_9GAMM|nr:gephyrin-like molybdotransferase Glp [Thalassolituus marinus]MCA6063756.1 molybdopterin molybdotransferase MoeA [Thalassolituus marinus]